MVATLLLWVTYGNILCFPSIEKKVCSFSQNYYDNKISKTFSKWSLVCMHLQFVYASPPIHSPQRHIYIYN